MQARVPPDLYEKQFKDEDTHNTCQLILALGVELEDLRQELLRKKKGEEYAIMRILLIKT